MSQQVNCGRSVPDNDREGDVNVKEDAMATYSRIPPRNISMDRESARTVLHEVRHVRRRPGGPSTPWKLPEDQDREEPRGTRSADDERQYRRRRRREPIERKDGYRVRDYHEASDQDDDDGDYDRRPSRHYRHGHSERHRSPPSLRVEQTPPPDHNNSGPLTPYNGNRELIRAPRRHSRSRRSSSSSSSSSDSEHDSQEAEMRAARNKKILYTGLATMTTLSAANGIYQVTKGYHGRRNAHKDGLSKGEWDEAERKKQRNKRLMMDGLAALTLAIGANNVRIGWQRREEKRKAHEEAERKAHEKRMARREDRYTVEELRSH